MKLLILGGCREKNVPGSLMQLVAVATVTKNRLQYLQTGQINVTAIGLIADCQLILIDVSGKDRSNVASIVIK